MFDKKKKGRTIYGVIGLGRFGRALATELVNSGADIIVLDKNEEKIAAFREFTENAYVTNNLDKKTLIETGIGNCDVAIVGIGEHIDTSILTVLNLVNLGIPQVIAKATSIEHGMILEKLGADVVYPEHDMAVRLAHRLETSRTLDFIQLSEQINISKLAIPDSAIGKTVIESNIRSRFGLNIIAIENHGKVIESVKPDYVFKKDDILYLSGSKGGFAKLAAWTD